MLSVIDKVRDLPQIPEPKIERAYHKPIMERKPEREAEASASYRKPRRSKSRRRSALGESEFFQDIARFFELVFSSIVVGFLSLPSIGIVQLDMYLYQHKKISHDYYVDGLFFAAYFSGWLVMYLDRVLD